MKTQTISITLKLILAMIILPKCLAAQIKNYKASPSQQSIEKIKIYGDKLSLEYKLSTPSPLDNPNIKKLEREATTGVLPALNVATAVLPSIFNFASNTVNRIVNNNLKKFVGEYEFRQTILFEDTTQTIDEIKLKRSVIEVQNEKELTAFELKLKKKTVTPQEYVFQLAEIKLPIAKAKATNSHPYLNVSIEIELIFVDDQGNSSSQKSNPIQVPLLRIGSSHNFINESQFYSSKFYSKFKPSEIKIKIIESNSSKAKFEAIKEDTEQINADIKDITQTLSLEIIKEYIEKLKKEEEQQELEYDVPQGLLQK